jgi:uncharacterized protein YecT (DUF1311 family)
MSLRTPFFALLLLSNGVSAATNTDIDYDAIYSECLKEMGGVNNGSVDACSTYASEAAKKEMTALYRKIYKTLGADSKNDAELLEQTQRAWIAYRNGQCKLAGAYVGSPMYSYCPMRLNIARVNELWELAGE